MFFFAVTHLGRGGSVPGWDLVSKLNEQINELWEFRMDWFFGWTRSGQFRKLISSGEQEGKVNTMQLVVGSFCRFDLTQIKSRELSILYIWKPMINE